MNFINYVLFTPFTRLLALLQKVLVPGELTGDSALWLDDSDGNGMTVSNSAENAVTKLTKTIRKNLDAARLLQFTGDGF